MTTHQDAASAPFDDERRAILAGEMSGDDDDLIRWGPLADELVQALDDRLHFYEPAGQEQAAREALVWLRSLPVEQRMEAMGMERHEWDGDQGVFIYWTEADRG